MSIGLSGIATYFKRGAESGLTVGEVRPIARHYSVKPDFLKFTLLATPFLVQVAVAGELEVVPAAMTEVISESGDGINPLWAPWAVEYDRFGNLYVAGAGSDNVFRVGKHGAIRQIIGLRGDGIHSLDSPVALATDSYGNVFVAGYQSHNVFRVSASGRVDQVIGPEGDGISPLEFPFSLAVDPDGVVYVSGFFSNNVFAITPGGSVEEVIDESGDGDTEFVIPTSMLVDRQGRLIVAASGTLFRLEPDLTVTTVFEASQERSIGFPYRIRSDGPGSVVAISDMNGLGDVRLLRNAADGSVNTILDVRGCVLAAIWPLERVWILRRWHRFP